MSPKAARKEAISQQMYVSIKDGEIKPVEKLPDLSDFHPFSGLHYCDGEAILPNGRRSLNWKKCELFSDEEIKSISNAATILERIFDNLNRLDAAKEAYQEFKAELESLLSNDQFAIATVDRRFRAYVFEWKLFLDHWKKYIDWNVIFGNQLSERWHHDYFRYYSKNILF